MLSGTRACRVKERDVSDDRVGQVGSPLYITFMPTYAMRHTWR